MTPPGRQWEAILSLAHHRYREAGRAYVWQTYPRVAGDGKYTDKAPPDFLGVLAGGRMCAIEAKDCPAGQLLWSRIADHQARDLEAVRLAGGLALLAVRLEGVGTVLEWAEVGPLWRAWRVASRASAVAPVGRVIDGGDWLCSR